MKRRHLGIVFLAAVMVLGAMPAASVQAQETKDTLRIMDDSESLSLDPYSTSGASGYVDCQLYDTLVHFDENGDLKPALAESWEESEDGTFYTVNLRQDVQFTDGTDVNADAVLSCYQRALEAPAIGATLAASISSMEKADDYTLTIAKATPYTDCLKLCATIFYIYSPAAYEADPDAFATTAAVGCGPYVLDHWDQTTGTVYLTANESYYAGAPQIKNLEIQKPMDSATALVALETGELDFIGTISENDIALAREEGIIVDQTYTGYSQKVLMLFGEPFTGDNNLRTAISYAVNGANAAAVAGVAEPKAAEDYCAGKVIGDYAGEAPLHSYDPEKAAEYLAQSSYAGETLEINVLASEENEAVSIQADLMAAGINAQVNVMDGNAWYEKMVSGTVQITILPIGSKYTSPEDVIQYYTTGGRYASICPMAVSEELEAQMEIVNGLWNKEERHPETVKALQMAVEVSNAIPLYDTAVSVAYNSSLKGYVGLNNMHFADCYFE